jgi:outer membrane protein assembly factor BamB
VTASSEPVREPLPDGKRLARGDAAGAAPAGPATNAAWPGPDDWPMFLRGPQRNSWTEGRLPASLRVRWSAPIQPPPATGSLISADWMDTNDYAGPISAPVVSGSTVCVAVREQHRVEAADAATGAKRWRFSAGARVVTPPTLYAGLCLFGSRDGWVYALRADTGALAWKFLAAPYERHLVAFSQVESAWPVLGSLLVHDGLAIAVAGYHPMAGGGIHVYGLVPRTGELKWHTTIARKPEWADLSQARTQIDQPHETTLNIGGFQANLVLNDLAYGLGPHVRFSGALLTAADGRLVSDTRSGKYRLGGGLGKLEPPGAMPLFINTFKTTLYRRHYFSSGGWSACHYGTSAYLKLPEAGETLTCERFAFSGPDAIVVQHARDGMLLRRYDARKLSNRDALVSDRTPTWTAPLDGPIGSRKAGQKTYLYASVLVAGDTAAVGGRLEGRHGSGEPVPGPRKVAEGIVRTFDARTGAPRQAIELDAAPVVSGLAAAAGRLYVACEDGSLRCLGE